MRVEIGGVLYVVTGAFQPTNEEVLPGEKLPSAAETVRPVPRHLHRAGRARDGVRAVAVESVDALAGRAVVRVVVVRLVGCDGLLEQDVRASRVVAYGEGDPVLVTLRVRKLHEEH